MRVGGPHPTGKDAEIGVRVLNADQGALTQPTIRPGSTPAKAVVASSRKRGGYGNVASSQTTDYPAVDSRGGGSFPDRYADLGGLRPLSGIDDSGREVDPPHGGGGLWLTAFRVP